MTIPTLTKSLTISIVASKRSGSLINFIRRLSRPDFVDDNSSISLFESEKKAISLPEANAENIKSIIARISATIAPKDGDVTVISGKIKECNCIKAEKMISKMKKLKAVIYYCIKYSINTPGCNLRRFFNPLCR